MVGVVHSQKDKDGRQHFTREDPFPCHLTCFHLGEPVAEAQDRMRCTLPMYRGEWKEPGARERVRLSQWLGAPPDYSDKRAPDLKPPEPGCDGCPGGWARCGYAESFNKYRRRRGEGGLHDTNPRVGPHTPGHILDALSWFEDCEAQAHGQANKDIYGN